MAAKRHERTLARRQAIQVLYQGEIIGEDPEKLLDDERAFIDGVKPTAYALELIRGTSEHQQEIDVKLKEYSENWALDRMPVVDRAILRLASYEILFVEEVPTPVAINEAVDLAKDFGGEDESPRFVNGVLGRVADSLEGESAASEGDSAEGTPEDTGEAAASTEVSPAEAASVAEAPAQSAEPAVEVVSAAASAAETVEEPAFAPAEETVASVAAYEPVAEAEPEAAPVVSTEAADETENA